MAYKKVLTGSYILGVGETSVGNISKEEYDEITERFRNKPGEADGFVYMLRDDTLAWEKIPVNPSIEDIEAAEALSIILGGDGV